MPRRTNHKCLYASSITVTNLFYLMTFHNKFFDMIVDINLSHDLGTDMSTVPCQNVGDSDFELMA